jgi:hypothetical protein
LTLTKLGRIAIWNRDKIVIGISMAIWIADIGFQIYGKYLPHARIIGEFLVNWWYYRYRAGEFSISTVLDQLDFLTLQP